MPPLGAIGKCMHDQALVFCCWEGRLKGGGGIWAISWHDQLGCRIRCKASLPMRFAVFLFPLLFWFRCWKKVVAAEVFRSFEVIFSDEFFQVSFHASAYSYMLRVYLPQRWDTYFQGCWNHSLVTSLCVLDRGDAESDVPLNSHILNLVDDQTLRWLKHFSNFRLRFDNSNGIVSIRESSVEEWGRIIGLDIRLLPMVIRVVVVGNVASEDVRIHVCLFPSRY